MAGSQGVGAGLQDKHFIVPENVDNPTPSTKAPMYMP
jgi:hypothetical protein